jgi:hypothetical protein
VSGKARKQRPDQPGVNRPNGLPRLSAVAEVARKSEADDAGEGQDEVDEQNDEFPIDDPQPLVRATLLLHHGLGDTHVFWTTTITCRFLGVFVLTLYDAVPIPTPRDKSTACRRRHQSP